jgi:hypothetical protein
MPKKPRMKRKIDFEVLDYYSNFCGFTIPCTDGGERFISPRDLIAYARDPEAWEANLNDTTVEALRAFVEYNRGGSIVQCSGSTKRGKQCKIWITPKPYVFGDLEAYGRLVYGKKFYCHLHG